MSDSNTSSLIVPVLETVMPQRRSKVALYFPSYSGDTVSANAQEKELHEWLKVQNRNHRLGTIVGVYQDDGRKQGTSSRAGLRMLKRAIRRKEVTLVVVPEFSDLGSLSRELYRLLRFFDRHHCGFRTFHEDLLFEELGAKDKLEGPEDPEPKVASEDSENEPAQ